MTSVFISYNRDSRPFVLELKQEFEARAISVWVDLESIPISSEWWVEIKRGIAAADVFLFVVTEKSLLSEVCNWEVAYARSLGKRILPVVKEDIFAGTLPQRLQRDDISYQTPDDLPAKPSANWELLRHVNFARVFDDPLSQHIATIIETVNVDPEHLVVHTRLVIRASEWDANGRDNAFLLRGTDLHDAEDWLITAAALSPPPTDLQTGYIVASRKGSNARQRVILTGISIALLVSSSLAALSFFFFNEATEERNLARTAQANAVVERDDRATAQNDAELQEQTAVGAAATADRRAQEVQSVLWANSAREAAGVRNNPLEGMSLAISAASISDPPALARDILAEMEVQMPILRELPYIDDSSEMTYINSDTQLIVGTHSGRVVIMDALSGDVLQEAELHDTSIQGMTYLPSENILITGTLDGILAWWQLPDLTLLERDDSAHSGLITELKISPDGQRLMSVSGGGRITLWDVQTRAQVWQIRLGHDFPAAAFSHDSKMIVTAAIQDEVRLWDALDGTLLRTFGPMLLNGAFDVAFTTDNTRVRATEGRGITWTWDVSSGGLIRDDRLPPPPQSDAVVYGSGEAWFSHDAARVMIWELADAMTIRDLSTSETRYRVRVPNAGQPQAWAMSATGNEVVISFFGGMMLVYDMNPLPYAARHDAHVSFGFDVIHTPDGRQAVSYQTSEVILWDLEDRQPVYRLPSGGKTIYRVALSNDGTKMIISNNEAIEIRDLASGVLITETEAPLAIVALSFSPDDRTVLASSLQDLAVYWLDVEQAMPFRQFEQTNRPLSIFDARFTSNGDQYLIVGSQGAQLRQVHDDSIIWTQDFSTTSTREVALSADGTTLALGETTGLIRVVQMTDGAVIARLSAHRSEISDLEFSNDNRFLVSSARDQTIRIRDVQTQQLLQTFTTSNENYGIGIHPAGNSILGTGVDGAMYEWRLESSDAQVARIAENRLIPELDCLARNRYVFEPACDADDTFPTRTPFGTFTPSITPTATITATAGVTRTMTPVPPTWTPSLTITLSPTFDPTVQTVLPPTSTTTPSVMDTVSFGSHRGEVRPGGAEAWQFEGTAAQIIRLGVESDRPAMTPDMEFRDVEGLDSLVELYHPDGSLLATNDDLIDGQFTDSQIDYAILPDDGIYTIVVRAWGNQSSGAYTLTIVALAEDDIESTQTATATMTTTPIPFEDSATYTPTPTVTLTSTPNFVQEQLQIGENRGELVPGQQDIWLFEIPDAGNIYFDFEVIADNPLELPDFTEPDPDGLDVKLTVYRSDESGLLWSTLLAQSDDRVPGFDTNAQVTQVPVFEYVALYVQGVGIRDSGAYTIIVRESVLPGTPAAE